jgi:hypothetical protein
LTEKRTALCREQLAAARGHMDGVFLPFEALEPMIQQSNKLNFNKIDKKRNQ